MLPASCLCTYTGPPPIATGPIPTCRIRTRRILTRRTPTFRHRHPPRRPILRRHFRLRPSRPTFRGQSLRRHPLILHIHRHPNCLLPNCHPLILRPNRLHRLCRRQHRPRRLTMPPAQSHRRTTAVTFWWPCYSCWCSRLALLRSATRRRRGVCSDGCGRRERRWPTETCSSSRCATPMARWMRRR